MLVLLRQSWCVQSTLALASCSAMHTFSGLYETLPSTPPSTACVLGFKLTEVVRQTWKHKLPIGLLAAHLVSPWGAVAGLTCCEGYLINVDSFCSAAEAKAGGAEQQAASDAEPQQPAAAPLQPRAVPLRPSGLKRKAAPLHALPRQLRAPAVAPVSSRIAASAVRPATRSGRVLAVSFLSSTCYFNKYRLTVESVCAQMRRYCGFCREARLRMQQRCLRRCHHRLALSLRRPLRTRRLEPAQARTSEQVQFLAAKRWHAGQPSRPLPRRRRLQTQQRRQPAHALHQLKQQLQNTAALMRAARWRARSTGASGRLEVPAGRAAGRSRSRPCPAGARCTTRPPCTQPWAVHERLRRHRAPRRTPAAWRRACNSPGRPRPLLRCGVCACRTRSAAARSSTSACLPRRSLRSSTSGWCHSAGGAPALLCDAQRWLSAPCGMLMPIQPITASCADSMPHARSCSPHVAPAPHLLRALQLLVQGLRHIVGLVARLAPSGRALLAGPQGAAQPPKGLPCSAPAARRACPSFPTAASASGSRALAAAAAATARKRRAHRTRCI